LDPQGPIPHAIGFRMPSGGTSLHNSALIEAYIREALRRHRSVHGCVVAGQMRIKKRKPSRAGVDLLNMMAHEISAQHTSLLVGWAGGRYSGRAWWGWQ